jgi:hypothetical protein
VVALNTTPNEPDGNNETVDDFIPAMDVRAATRAAPTDAPNEPAMTTDAQTTDIIEPATGKTVGDMMDAFKSLTTVEYIKA